MSNVAAPFPTYTHTDNSAVETENNNGKLQRLEIHSWQGIALSRKTYENNSEWRIPSVPSIGYFIPD
jgi:hypothetical protein